MNFDLTKEQREIKQEIMDFAYDNLNNNEYLEKYSADMFQKVAEFGLLGITIGEQYGGLEESYLTAAIAFEALGYACKNNGFIFTVNNHIWVAQNLIYLYGNEALKEKYVSCMVKGKKIGAIAITEAESGSDAFSMMTNAIEDGDDYILNGSKMFISNGPIADVFIVFAITKESPIRKYTAFVVEKDFEGFKVCSEIEKMGLGACPTSEIVLDNCRVPKNNILGHLDKGANLMTFALEWERLYEFVPHIG
ncbi:MAG: acyl-CoA dehydrogenase family protein, partial [Bacillota bacterium]|nr:acyl-CoA dehydrogenase family protein [Bacillota bacterium]